MTTRGGQIGEETIDKLVSIFGGFTLFGGSMAVFALDDCCLHAPSDWLFLGDYLQITKIVPV